MLTAGESRAQVRQGKHSPAPPPTPQEPASSRDKIPVEELGRKVATFLHRELFFSLAANFNTVLY